MNIKSPLITAFVFLSSILLSPTSFAHDAAQHAFWQGDYGQAIQLWQKAVENSTNPVEQLDYHIKVALSQRQLGAYTRAQESLQQARQLLQTVPESTPAYPSLAAQFYNEYSKLMLSKGSQHGTAAQQAVAQALSLAETASQADLYAQVLNQQGNLQGLLLDYEAALNSYNDALERLPATQHELRSKIQINRAHKIYLLDVDNAYQHDDLQQAYQNSRRAILQTLAEMQAWQDSYAQIMGLIRLAQLAGDIQQQLPTAQTDLSQARLKALQKALRLAQNIQQPSALTHVYLALADLYQQHAHTAQALRLNRQAVFHAQQARDNKLFYLGLHQQGQLFQQQGAIDEAIKAYQQATEKLTPIRLRDAQTGYCNIQQSFRERIAPVYFELADLLLQQAAQTADVAQKHALLKRARDSIESFKGAELQAYYRDDCITLHTSTPADQQLDAHSVVLYPISLPNRLELLLSFNQHIEQVTVPVSQQQLTQTAALFLSPLRSHPNPELQERSRDSRGVSRGVSRGDSESLYQDLCVPQARGSLSLPPAALRFQQPAQQLYDWLIAPLQNSLQQHAIDTLIIAPDGALRTIPFAALRNGEHFLIEKYALAVIPSLSLSRRQTHSKPNPSSILIAGLSEARHGFAEIPCVEYEINSLHELLKPQHQPLLNQSFLKANLQQQLTDKDYRFVHIATHGQFSANLAHTFILTYDQTLPLNALEKLMKSSKVRKHPIELLTLSACETAAGDDKAALGLAGVALKAGVNSALASLWQVDDEATPTLVLEFYKQLMQHPERGKARALQQAQSRLLQQPAFAAYRHPYFWAAFLLIGDWL